LRRCRHSRQRRPGIANPGRHPPPEEGHHHDEKTRRRYFSASAMRSSPRLFVEVQLSAIFTDFTAALNFSWPPGAMVSLRS